MQNFKTKPDGSTIYESVEGNDIKTYADILAQRERDGVTGDISPNVEHGMLLREYIDKFQHDFGTATAEDCYFILSKAHMGTDKEGKAEPDILMSLHGNPHDLSCVLAYALSKDPIILSVVERAVQYAKNRQLKRQLGGLFDGLAQAFGHGSAKEWSNEVNKNRQDPKPESSNENPQRDASK